jgi:cation transport ATPase
MAARCRVVHAIRGRLRMRVDLPQIFDVHSGACEAFLRDRPGIQEVRLNPGCRSVVLNYNPDVLRADDLVTLVEELPIDQLNTYQPRNPPRQAEDSSSMAWLPLALSSAAVALGVLAETAAAPWLAVGAAVPIFTRAFEAITQRGKLNVDVLDAAATAVLAAQAQIQTAALMAWLVSLGDVIRELTMQRSRRAVEEFFDGRTQFAWVDGCHGRPHAVAPGGIASLLAQSHHRVRLERGCPIRFQARQHGRDTRYHPSTPCMHAAGTDHFIQELW